MCVKLLTALSGSEDIQDQLSYIQNLDNGTRKIISNTVLGSEMFVAYCYLRCFSGSHSLEEERILGNREKLMSAAKILAGYLDE